MGRSRQRASQSGQGTSERAWTSSDRGFLRPASAAIIAARRLVQKRGGEGSPMRITAVTSRILSSAFSYGNPAGPGGNLHLRAMDTLLVQVETDAGLTGHGEGFG